MAIWNNTENCEYPVGDADEAIPEWIVVDGEVIEAWYRNPEMNVFWFESDSGKELEANLWIETSSLVGKPDLSITQKYGLIMLQPKHPKKTNEPVKYHCHDSCNKCGEVNEYTVTDSLDGHMMECKTKCKTCGHEDYWAHGWFESSQEFESKCNTYSFY